MEKTYELDLYLYKEVNEFKNKIIFHQFDENSMTITINLFEDTEKPFKIHSRASVIANLRSLSYNWYERSPVEIVSHEEGIVKFRPQKNHLHTSGLTAIEIEIQNDNEVLTFPKFKFEVKPRLVEGGTKPLPILGDWVRNIEKQLEAKYEEPEDADIICIKKKFTNNIDSIKESCICECSNVPALSSPNGSVYNSFFALTLAVDHTVLQVAFGINEPYIKTRRLYYENIWEPWRDVNGR